MMMNTGSSEEFESLVASKQFRQLLYAHWRDILVNLPLKYNETEGRYEPACVITDKLERMMDSGGGGKDRLVGILKSRRVTGAELCEAMSKIGLEIVTTIKPETDMIVSRRSDRLVRVHSGESVELAVFVEAYPAPSYTFYKAQIVVGRENVLRITNARLQDSGEYQCEIVQTKRNGQVTRRVETFQLVVDAHREKLTVRMKTDKQRVEMGASVIIEVLTSEKNNQEELQFEWFKTSLSCQDELIKNNPSANGPVLTIHDVDEGSVGVYKCQVSRLSTNEKVISAGCDLQVNKRSEFDLKIALIIGNANYNMSRVHCGECGPFKTEVKHLLPLYTSLEQMKEAFEKLNYLVLSFIDLNADEYLRAVRVVRQLCHTAKHVSVLVYVAGHGIHSNRHDFLVPIDSVSIVHANDHNRRRLDHFISLCSLNNLLENFISDDDDDDDDMGGGKFNVICLWDLCRRSWDNIDIETTVDNKLKDSLEYTIIYSCFVGEQGYVIGDNYPDYDLKAGSIFANLFIRNLNLDQKSLIYQIAEKINNNLKELRGKPGFKGSKLSNLKINSTLNEVDLYAKASNHTYYKNLIQSTLLMPEQKIHEEKDHRGVVVCRHRFLPDKFVNSVLLELGFHPSTHIDFDTFKPVDAVAQSVRALHADWTQVTWRLSNIVGPTTQPIKILLKLASGHARTLTIRMPEHFSSQLYDTLYSAEINKYVEEKNATCNDEIYSVTSVETDEMTSDNASMTTSDSEDFESH